MFFARGFAFIALMIALTSCAAPMILTPTRAPIAPTALPTPQATPFVEVALFGESGQGALTTAVGNTITVTLAFRPSQRTVLRASDGTPTTVTTDWKNHTVAQMRYCIGQGCALTTEWLAFAERVNMRVPVDWVGLREYSITAQFRDANGANIPAGFALSESATRALPITGIVDERTPNAARPPALQTVVTHAQNEFPVVGKLQVGERPIAGGKAGTRLDIKVKFEAVSPRGDVKEMRVKLDRLGRCLTPDEMQDARWEPFAAEKIYPVTIAINWQSFRAHVQYRDAAGNLSPVYCGEIAIEGMP
ncbi:MAG: hypothetical protein HY868_03225 [Chloroflexi bacterium]|nr:hypothetical protein [Chloroflexota bacterium]